jgi:hypothetical protein
MSFPYAVRYLSYYFFFYKDLTHILLDNMHYNKSYFLLFFYILFILKFPFFMYFSPIVYDIRRLAVEYARTSVSGVLSFIPINDLAACCCWRRWSFLPRDSRWADGRIFSAFQIFTNRLYTHSFFLFCFSDETSLPVILPASTQQRSNNNSAKKKNNSHIYTQVDICVHSQRTPLIHR